MKRGWILTAFLLLEGLWLALDIPFLLPLKPAPPTMLFYGWLASDGLLLCSVVLVGLWSRSGVIGFVGITAVREGLLVWNEKGLSPIGVALAVVLVALVARHWGKMQWGIVRAPVSVARP